MSTIVQVEKNQSETNINLIRRFTKRAQSVGVIQKVRSLRYRKRGTSKFSQKKQALKVLERREKIFRLIKLGKLPDKRRTAQQS